MDDCGSKPDGMRTPTHPSLSPPLALPKIFGNFYHRLVCTDSCGTQCKSRDTVGAVQWQEDGRET